MLCFGIYLPKGKRGDDRLLLTLPVLFDQNEWFVILSDLIFLLVWMLLPQRFPAAVVVMILLFNATLSLTADYTISAALPFDLYDYNDTSSLDLFDELLHFTLYPLSAYLFVYWWDVWRSRRFPMMLYILLGAGISTLYEWISDLAHVFTYKGWHLYDSAIAYLILLSINIYFLSRLKKWLSLPA